MGTWVSRRSFLARAGLASSALVPGVLAEPANAKQVELEVFKLDPEWNSAGYCRVDEGKKPGSCHGCKACHLHATFKLFPSREAADANRAHPFCRCLVVSGGTLPRHQWVALFGNPRHPRRDSVDKRDHRVSGILKTRQRSPH